MLPDPTGIEPLDYVGRASDWATDAGLLNCILLFLTVLVWKVWKTYYSFRVAEQFTLTVRRPYGTNELQRQKTYLWTCAPSEDSDQPVHSHSLIRILLDAKFLHAENKDRSDCADAQGDLSLRWAHVRRYVIHSYGSDDRNTAGTQSQRAFYFNLYWTVIGQDTCQADNSPII